MPDELVAIAEAVQRAALAHDDRVVERPAQRQPVLAHGAQVLEEAVRARRRVLLDERLLRRRARQHLRADRGVVVVERVADPERARGLDVDPARARADADRVRDVDGAAPGRLRSAPGREEQRDERLGAAVDGRDLGAVHLDLEVVDPQAGGGGHQVLDRLDPGPVASDRRRVVRVDDALRRGRDALGPDAEDDARVRRGRGHREAHGLAGVKADPVEGCRLADRVLSHHAAGRGSNHSARLTVRHN